MENRTETNYKIPREIFSGAVKTKITVQPFMQKNQITVQIFILIIKFYESEVNNKRKRQG